MNYLKMLSAALGFLGYVFLIATLLQNREKQQSFASYLLWFILEILLITATYLEGGNYSLQLGYATGGIVTVIILFIRKEYAWNWVTTLVTVLIVACVVIWKRSGNEAGIIAMCIAIFIATIPQAIDTSKYPEKTPINVWWIWTAGNFCSLIAGKDWSVEERLFPVSALLGSLLILGIVYIKRIRNKTPAF